MAKRKGATLPRETRFGWRVEDLPSKEPALARLSQRVALTHVVVPPYLRVEDGKVIRVEGYTYERAGVGDLSSLRTATKTAPAPTSLLAKTNVEDQRKPGGPPIHLDADRFEAAATAVGIDISKVKSIKLRFRDLSQNQGSTQDLGGGNFRVVVGIKPKKDYEERHLYVVNNSLVHELRHVTQMQNGNKTDYKAGKEQFGAANLQHAKGGGYVGMEVEAQMFGRLAWHGDPAKKSLGPLGEDKGHMGKTLWAIGFTPEVKLSKVEDLAVKLAKSKVDPYLALRGKKVVKVGGYTRTYKPATAASVRSMMKKYYVPQTKWTASARVSGWGSHSAGFEVDEERNPPQPGVDYDPDEMVPSFWNRPHQQRHYEAGGRVYRYEPTKFKADQRMGMREKEIKGKPTGVVRLRWSGGSSHSEEVAEERFQFHSKKLLDGLQQEGFVFTQDGKNFTISGKGPKP